MKIVKCHNLKGEGFNVEADKLIWRPSVYGILFSGNKILLSKQWDGYDFPGGGADIHETVTETLQREFWEETGLRIEPLMPIHCETSFFHPDHAIKYQDDYWNCPLLYFLCQQTGGEISKDNFDEAEKEYADLPEWIDVDKVKGLKFYNSINSAEVITKAFAIWKKVYF